MGKNAKKALINNERGSDFSKAKKAMLNWRHPDASPDLKNLCGQSAHLVCAVTPMRPGFVENFGYSQLVTISVDGEQKNIPNTLLVVAG